MCETGFPPFGRGLKNREQSASPTCETGFSAGPCRLTVPRGLQRDQEGEVFDHPSFVSFLSPRLSAFRVHAALPAAVVLLMAGAGVRAQGVGNLGGLPPTIPMTGGGITWEVGVPNPLPVVRDPLGPVWKKTLTDQNGGPFTAVSGQTFTLHEVLVISGNEFWSDWHEDIVEPEWSWTGAQIFINNNIPAGLVINNVPGNAVQGGSISFLFNPVAPGSVVDIFKHLTYHGNPAVPPFTGTLTVNQYPTPEPASLALLASGGLVLMRRRVAK